MKFMNELLKLLEAARPHAVSLSRVYTGVRPKFSTWINSSRASLEELGYINKDGSAGPVIHRIAQALGVTNK